MRQMMAALAVAVLLIGCTEEEPTYEFVLESFDKVEGPTVTAALDHFKTACPDLFRSWADVDRAVVKRGDSSLNYTGETFGWTREIWVEVKISDRPDHLRTAGGHTLFYILGTGKQPGMVIQKDVSARACGIEPAGGGSDTFVPDDGFEMLADLRS